jgi:mono/diheme cytochrome c family protein
MKTIKRPVIFLLFIPLMVMNCSNPPEKQSGELSASSKETLVARGKYLVTVAGCNDCHSPKVMTAHGPEPDTTRLLSGHPEGEPLAPVVLTKDWLLFNNGLTAFVGPWGVSYAANLTPDDTGIGNWKLEQFIIALRQGKYKGLENSRPLLPPMPWQMYRNMTDEDLEAVFTYLKSLPAVKNLVPVPVSPEKVAALAHPAGALGK